MATVESVKERLIERGGLEELPTARAALEQAKKDLSALEDQRGRLLPNVISSERTAITARVVAEVSDAYKQEQARRLKALESERGRAIADAAGVEALPVGAERRAIETQWAAEVPAVIAALPHIADVPEIQDIADAAFARQSPLLIRTIVPAVLQRLRALDAGGPEDALRARFGEWRKENPTFRDRIAAIDARAALITSTMSRSRDMLLEVHGLRNRWDS